MTGKPVPGAVFEVKEGSTNILGNYTTGKYGTVTVTGLIPAHTYVVTEVKVSDGYVLNSTPQTITVQNGANTLSGSTTSGTGTTTGGTGSDNDLTFENDPTMTLRACLISQRVRIFERIFRRSRRKTAGILCVCQG